MKSVNLSAKLEEFHFICTEIAPDKSISHRSAMFALLAKGVSKIQNFLKAEDTLNTLKIVEALGAKVSEKDGLLFIETDGNIKEANNVLDCGNSGTGIRLFCGLLASQNIHSILTGDEYLRKRPMKRVTNPLREIGATIDGGEGGNLAPLSIRGASLEPFNYKSAIASAQVKTAMILAALQANGTSTYQEDELSRDHTERMLKGMGVDISTDTNLITTIKPLKAPLKPLDIHVPADPSSAFFFAVAAAITPNSKIILKDISLNPTRIEAYKVLERMGVDIEYVEKESVYEPIGDIVVSYNELNAVCVEENISWLIDELPALSIAFACAKGVSTVKNAKELRVKESDRISCVVENLNRCGIKTTEFEDGYTVEGGKIESAFIDSFGDHRIAMSFSIASLKADMQVNDIECTETSFPNFYEILSKLVEVKHENRASI